MHMNPTQMGHTKPELYCIMHAHSVRSPGCHRPGHAGPEVPPQGRAGGLPCRGAVRHGSKHTGPIAAQWKWDGTGPPHPRNHPTQQGRSRSTHIVSSRRNISPLGPWRPAPLYLTRCPLRPAPGPLPATICPSSPTQMACVMPLRLPSPFLVPNFNIRLLRNLFTFFTPDPDRLRHVRRQHAVDHQASHRPAERHAAAVGVPPQELPGGGGAGR